MPTRAELKQLAKLRLKEAETLYSAELYDGVAYLCGYAVEFALKARICRLLSLDDYPPSGELRKAFAVHDFDQLLLLSGLKPKMDPSNSDLFTNWSIATPWTPERRYMPKGTFDEAAAKRIIDAVSSKPNGILSWIMRYW